MTLLMIKYTLVLAFTLGLNRIGFGSAATRHLILTLAFFSPAIIYLLEMALPQAEIFAIPSPEFAWHVVTQSGPATAQSTRATSTPGALNWQTVLISGYWLVTALLLLHWLRLLLTTHIQIKRAAQLTGPQQDATVAMATNPFAWGVFTPKVVVPEDFSNWPQKHQAMALAHEQAHISRHDGAVLIVTALWSCFLWWHPLVWIARRRILIEAERACDDIVLSQDHDKLAYAEILLQLQKNHMPQAAPAMASKSTLAERIYALLDKNTRRNEMTRLSLTRTSGLVVLLLLPLALVGNANALQTITSDVLTRLETAQAHIDQQQYSIAQASLQELLSESLNKNERAQVHNLIAYIDYLQGRYDDAIRSYEQVVTKPDAIPQGLQMTSVYTLAQLNFVQERYNDSLKWITEWQGLAENPGPIPMVFKAQLLYQMGRFPQALNTLNQALKLAENRDMEPNPKWLELKNHLQTVVPTGAKSTTGKPASNPDGDLMLIARVRPVYPYKARQNGIEGYVDVRFDVDTSGRVVEPQVVASEPAEVFDSAAMAAVAKYKYKPAVISGEAVGAVDLQTRVEFSIDD